MSKVEREIDQRPVLNARRIVSESELTLSYVNVRAVTFGKLLEEMITAHPDVDVTTVRLEESDFTLPGGRSVGKKLQIRARKGSAE